MLDLPHKSKTLHVRKSSVPNKQQEIDYKGTDHSLESSEELISV